jgi:hypothetical protein
MDVSTLHRMSTDELVRALEHGHPVDPHALDDTEYRGTSLGLPGFVERLTWKKFRKTFHRDPATGALRGWNVRLVQNGREAPDVPRTKRALLGAAVPHTFGHYEVVSATGYPMPTWKGRVVWAHRGLMIDYGRGANPPGLMRRVRDPLVAVNAGDPTLLLGWSYVDLGFARVGTPSFFTLELAGPLTHRA